MSEDHIMKIRNGCTLEEMAKMNLPGSRTDPISKQLMPNFHYSLKQAISQRNKHNMYLNENNKAIEPKVVPSSHYIESRFYAYSKAMITNRPIISQLQKNLDVSREELSSRSLTTSRFHISKFPNAPLTKELSDKVNTVNSFYVKESKKTKRINNSRTVNSGGSSRRFVKPNKLMSNIKSWQKIKREKTEKSIVEKTHSIAPMFKVSDLHNESISNLPQRPKSESRFFRSQKNPKKLAEMVATIESLSSMVSPLAPVYAAGRMVPQSPNLLMYPYTRYGHLF